MQAKNSLCQLEWVSPHNNWFNPSNEDEGMSYSETPRKWAKLGYFGSHLNSLSVFVLFNFFPKGSLVPAIYNICRLMQVFTYQWTKDTIRKKDDGHDTWGCMKALLVINNYMQYKVLFNGIFFVFWYWSIINDKYEITCKGLKLFAEFPAFSNQVHYFLPAEKVTKLEEVSEINNLTE